MRDVNLVDSPEGRAGQLDRGRAGQLDSGLAGKTALVTGGSTGIGRAIALALGAEGVALAVASRNPDEGAIEEMRALGVTVVAIRADLSTETGAVHAVGTALGSLGRLDLLVVNAATVHHEPVTKVTTSSWDQTLRTNLTGAMWVCRAACVGMIERTAGSILIVGSTAQYTRAPAESAYHVSKAALAAYASALAVELAPHGIRVNMLVPGSFPTALNAALRGNEERLLVDIPLGRRGEPAECGPAAVFLLSDRLASYVTGAELVISGGMHLRPYMRMSRRELKALNEPDRSEPSSAEAPKLTEA